MRRLPILLVLLAVLSLAMFDTGCSSANQALQEIAGAAREVREAGEKVNATADILSDAAEEAQGKSTGEQIAIMIGALLAAMGVWKGTSKVNDWRKKANGNTSS